MVSVVIPAFNEEKHIGRCIESLIHQTTQEKYEVIVVDNNSTDNTFNVASSYKNKLNLHVIKESKKGRGTARFTGFRAAKGDIIFSLDGDSYAPSDWIEKMIRPFSDPKIVAVSGTGRIEDCTPRINRTFNIVQPICMKGYRLIFGHYWLTGFNFAIRAKSYKEAGEFNQHITSNEDVDLSFRVRKIGKIKFLKLPVTVSGRRVKNGVVRGLFSYVPSFLTYYVLKKPPELSDVR
jgi:glycosyltransferase involved in cell wall biosynthesis